MVDGGGEERGGGQGQGQGGVARFARWARLRLHPPPPAARQLMLDPVRGMHDERRSAIKRARLLRGSYAPRLHC